jgi:glycosyltransferase involved in cell wall biosynthesis
MINPLVSVSCITYNQEAFIGQCLDGFFSQITNFEFEILIHDDASTDRTKEIIEDYKLRFPNKIFTIYQTENQYSKGVRGIMVKFNFSRARGKYIALCEGDDYWTDPYKLQKQVDFLEKNENYSACFHEVSMFDQKNKVVTGSYSNLQKDVISTGDLFNRHFIATCSVLFRNYSDFPDLLKKGFASADKWLLFNLSLKGDIKFLNETMGVYRLHSGGISNLHVGIKKVYDTAYLLNKFDELSKYQFTTKCHESLFYEIESHLFKINTPENILASTKSTVFIGILFQRLFTKIKRTIPFLHNA